MAKPKKRDYQKIHAMRRAIERYGLPIGEHGLAEIVAKIRRGESEFVMNRTHRLSIHKVVYNGVDVIVMYDRNEHAVCTFLLEEHIDQYKKEIEDESRKD